jgi:hypothetical protein
VEGLNRHLFSIHASVSLSRNAAIVVLVDLLPSVHGDKKILAIEARKIRGDDVFVYLSNEGLLLISAEEHLQQERRVDEWISVLSRIVYVYLAHATLPIPYQVYLGG